VKTSANAAESGGDLLTSIHRYRVMQGEKIVGQFSNLPLAEATAHQYRGTAVVLDISVKPPLVVHRDGRSLKQSA
jgi:hypothetical protein